MSLVLLVVPLLLLTIAPKSMAKIANKINGYYVLIALMSIIFVENATFPFFAQYDVRPNYLFVEYLEYPKEVFGMILADYKLSLGISFVLMLVVGRLYLNSSKNNAIKCFDMPYSKRLLLLIPLIFIFALGIRSSLGHRPANISDALYSSNRVLNEVTKNSPYSVLYAIYSTKNDANIGRYGVMPIDQAINRVKSRLNIHNDLSQQRLNRVEPSHFKHKKPKNLVLFIQESMGAQFVAATGGEQGITPNLNRLSREGLLFTDAYSNGTRSIRGLAGLIAGNYSVPGKGVLKRNKSQQGFFTISSLLEPYGYKTLFVYGGEARFDNMKSWFAGNGFDKIIEQKDFDNPSYVGTWGVSDEDLIIKSNQLFAQHHKDGQPFAAVMFSTSNHTPFDFPDGKIDLVEGVEKKSVNNAIKYADHAIGEFIKRARKEPYYKDTIFVIASDHDVRVYGDDMVPVNHFQIPALILGEGVEPAVYNKIATQPDILATAIDLLGIDKPNYPIMGHSIFSDKKQNIALMQFNETYALRKDNKVAIVRPNQPPLTFNYIDQHLQSTEHDIELETDALAFVIVLDHLYQNKLYKSIAQ